MIYEYKSVFKNDIIELVKEKRALGYSYIADERKLKYFDEFCHENHPHISEFNEELMSSWAQSHAHYSNNGLNARLTPIRQLALFMLRNEKTAYIPPLAKATNFVPHIFSEEELKRIFVVTDNYERKKEFSPLRKYTLSVLLRLIYCCGLRPSEGRTLKTEQIDFLTGRITIFDSKNRDRIVVASDDLLKLLRRYRTLLERHQPSSGYFFPSWHEKPYDSASINESFRYVLDKANVKSTGDASPRVYDLRHTFATRRLYSWMKEEKDLTVFLPYLSVYMGHSSIFSTAYYLHLVPDFYQQAKIDMSKYENLLPEVSYEIPE